VLRRDLSRDLGDKEFFFSFTPLIFSFDGSKFKKLCTFAVFSVNKMRLDIKKFAGEGILIRFARFNAVKK
jgi:hypothetical protein